MLKYSLKFLFWKCTCVLVLRDIILKRQTLKYSEPVNPKSSRSLSLSPPTIRLSLSPPVSSLELTSPMTLSNSRFPLPIPSSSHPDCSPPASPSPSSSASPSLGSALASPPLSLSLSGSSSAPSLPGSSLLLPLLFGFTSSGLMLEIASSAPPSSVGFLLSRFFLFLTDDHFWGLFLLLWL